MAAGTAAALVPIRSITRKIDPSSPQSLASTVKQHPRLSLHNGEETVTLIPESQEDAGPICLKLLTTLKGIQLGKIEDKFGWSFNVLGSDGEEFLAKNGTTNGNGPTVDQLD